MSNPKANPVLTVGHSNHEADGFLQLLQGQAVEVLVDVRRFPGSRGSRGRNPSY